MKILRIIARLNVGGPARHVVWLTSELQGEEFQTKLVAGTVPKGEEDMDYFAEEHGVKPEYLQEMSRELSPKDLVSLVKLVRLIKRERPDVIHTHTAKAGTLGRSAAFLYRYATWKTLIGRPRNVRIIHTFHGHIFHSYYGSGKTKIFLAIEKLLARLATDKIVVISPQQLDEIHGTFGIGRKKQFSVIPLGIDLDSLAGTTESRASFRREVRVDEEVLLVGFVGRLTEIKNLSLLLQAAARYKAGEGLPKAEFVIIGDGHLRPELEAEAKQLGITDIVRFVGNRDDPRVFYSGLDIVALTSRNEGTPLSLIEGMAAGKPVIATGVGGVKDLLGSETERSDGFSVCDRGIRVDDQTPESFCRALIYLLKNEKLRASMAKAGRVFIRSRYGKDRLINDIKDLYRSETIR